MLVFRLNRTVQGLPAGTIVFRGERLPRFYSGTVTVTHIEAVKKFNPDVNIKYYHLPYSRLELVHDEPGS